MNKEAPIDKFSVASLDRNTRRHDEWERDILVAQAKVFLSNFTHIENGERKPVVDAQTVQDAKHFLNQLDP